MDDFNADQFVFLKEGDETPRSRGARMFADFVKLDNSHDMVIKSAVGINGDRTRLPSIVVEFDGNQYPFTTGQARIIADIFDSIFDEHVCGSDSCELTGLNTFANFLRDSSQMSEQQFKDEARGTLQ